MSRELDEQCARALGYAALWAEDSAFGPSLYLHDAGAIREPNGTSNAHLLGARWERLRVNDAVDWFFVRLCPAFSENHEAARILEDEVERKSLEREYTNELRGIVCPYNDMSDIGIQWLLIRATPEQKCRAFLEAVEV